jgi:hypothetical protein
VCLIHSIEALPVQGDSASLSNSDPESVNTINEEEKSVEAARKQLDAVKAGRNSPDTQMQTPPNPAGSSTQPDRMPNEIVQGGGVENDDLVTDTDAMSMHAQTMRESDKPSQDGRLKPGQKGFFRQQVTGGHESFKTTMEKIDRKLHLKHQKERQEGYQSSETAKMATEASQAVGAMAQEVQKESMTNAEHKASQAAECAIKLKSTSDEEEKELIAKECQELLDQKKKAYAEAADAMAASEKAIDAAGNNEGKILGRAGLHQDGTMKLLQAQKAATGAKLKLKEFESESAKDMKILAERQRLEANTKQLMERAQQQEQQAQDSYDLRMAQAEAAPPPRETAAQLSPTQSAQLNSFQPTAAFSQDSDIPNSQNQDVKEANAKADLLKRKAQATLNKDDVDAAEAATEAARQAVQAIDGKN